MKTVIATSPCILDGLSGHCSVTMPRSIESDTLLKILYDSFLLVRRTQIPATLSFSEISLVCGLFVCASMTYLKSLKIFSPAIVSLFCQPLPYAVSPWLSQMQFGPNPRWCLISNTPDAVSPRLCPRLGCPLLYLSSSIVMCVILSF